MIRWFCRHRDAVREHRADGWYWVCYRCKSARLINPVTRPRPIAIGVYDEARALAGKQRAELANARRQSIDASRSRCDDIVVAVITRTAEVK